MNPKHSLVLQVITAPIFWLGAIFCRGILPLESQIIEALADVLSNEDIDVIKVQRKEVNYVQRVVTTSTEVHLFKVGIKGVDQMRTRSLPSFDEQCLGIVFFDHDGTTAQAKVFATNGYLFSIEFDRVVDAKKIAVNVRAELPSKKQ
jgi:hypothetical protein